MNPNPGILFLCIGAWTWHCGLSPTSHGLGSGTVNGSRPPPQVNPDKLRCADRKLIKHTLACYRFGRRQSRRKFIYDDSGSSCAGVPAGERQLACHRKQGCGVPVLPAPRAVVPVSSRIWARAILQLFWELVSQARGMIGLQLRPFLANRRDGFGPAGKPPVGPMAWDLSDLLYSTHHLLLIIQPSARIIPFPLGCLLRMVAGSRRCAGYLCSPVFSKLVRERSPLWAATGIGQIAAPCFLVIMRQFMT